MDHDYSTHIMPRKARPTQRGYGGPILALILALVAWVFVAFAAFAQSSESTAISGANSEVQVTTGAAAGSAINNYGQKAGKEARTYQELSTAPSLGGLALGGGHPCAFSPATAQISIVGGGAGVGGMKVDSACMLMVMGATGDKAAYKAAQLVIAGRDPAACAAMQTVGLVTNCPEKRKRRPAGGAVTGDLEEPTKISTGAKCIKEGRKIIFRATSSDRQAVELAACKALFGV